MRRLVPKEATGLCELSLTLTSNGSIMLVLEALNSQYSRTCQAASLALMDALSKPSKSRFNKVIRPAAFLTNVAQSVAWEQNKNKTKQNDQAVNQVSTNEQVYENVGKQSEHKKTENTSGGVLPVSCSLSALMGATVLAAVLVGM